MKTLLITLAILTLTAGIIGERSSGRPSETTIKAAK